MRGPPGPPASHLPARGSHADHGRRAVFRTSQLEEAAGEGRNPTGNRTMGEIIAARFSRRGFLARLDGGDGDQRDRLARSRSSPPPRPGRRARRASAFDFPEVEAGVDADHHVAEGYDADILLRWGDPLFPDSPEFDPLNQTPEAQARQFGYNNDFVGFIPIEGSSEHGLLVVNHEYTNPHLMFPGIVTVAGEARRPRSTIAPADQKRVDIEMAAHGGTIVEIREGRRPLAAWCATAAMNRRITADDRDGDHRPGRRPPAPADLGRSRRHAGPRHRQQLRRRRHALGHLHHGRGELPRLLHRRAARGPCRGGELRAARRAGRRPTSGATSTTASTLARSRTSRTASAGSSRSTSMDPTSMPKKRTALGRFKHEGAESIVERRRPRGASISATTSASTTSTSS